MPKLLTKSKYMSGLQCPKKLWIETNQRDLIPPVTPSQQFIFDQGHEVGDIAQKRYPKGFLLPQNHMQIKENVEQTKKELETPRPLFEAGFQFERCYARVDILNPVEGGWELIEVKSSTKPKDEHFPDLAFQKWILEKNDIPIKKVSLLVVNREYVKHGDLDVNEFMTKHEVDVEVNEHPQFVEKNVTTFLNTMDQKTCPETPIGYQCTKPHECPIIPHCWKDVPDRSVFDLERDLKLKKALDLIEQGILHLKDIPKDYDLKPKQVIQVEAAKSGNPIINKEEIKRFLKDITYPIHCLDFETIGPAVPIFDNTSPFDAIPVQFSIHTIEEDNTITHKEFLVEKPEDQNDFAKALIEAIPDKGTVLEWTAYEERCIKMLIKEHPNLETKLQKILQRIIDLNQPFKQFHYYHPDQKGKSSIKNVLPVMTELTYKDLEVQGGNEAAMLILDLWKNPSKKRKDDLLAYCAMDTEGMVKILKELQRLSK